MVISGYKMSGTDLKEIQDSLKRAGDKIKKIAGKEYAALLADKAAFLFDCIVLQMCERPADREIIDDAVSQLSDEIAIAGRLGTRSRYNFSVYARVAVFEDVAYMWINCGNDKFLKAFTGLEEYSLSSEESKNQDNKKTKTWLAVFEQSKSIEPMGVNLTHIPALDKEELKKLKYPDIGVRSEKMARHNLLNQYLNLLSGGRQIPPVYMMEYVDRAMEMLVSDDGAAELNTKVTQLAQILPDLNENKQLIIGEDDDEAPTNITEKQDGKTEDDNDDKAAGGEGDEKKPAFS